MLDWLAFVEYELLIFAGVFFLIGALDEFAMDLVWFWLKITRKAETPEIDEASLVKAPLRGVTAVFIAAWQEEAVIGHTVRHTLDVWPQADLRLYVGCYPNDIETQNAVRQAAGNDERVRLIINPKPGPTTKADCLTQILKALYEDEAKSGVKTRSIVLHDAEDMVDPAALPLIDRAMDDCDFVQIPVLALPHPRSRWVASHYIEEFAESHAKTMVVRDALGANIPAAGVGCAFSRDLLSRISDDRGGETPFSEHSLTEDYELGLRVSSVGGRSCFLRARTEEGRLIATRAYFPASMRKAVRQKARWLQGIAFQGWDSLGWEGGMAERWMRLRDRRGPLAALVLGAGYLIVILSAFIALLSYFGFSRPWTPGPPLFFLLYANMAFFVWRILLRFIFVRRDYNNWEALRAVIRIPLSNIIAIMAGRLALFNYIKAIFGHETPWDKTEHDEHPITLARAGKSA